MQYQCLSIERYGAVATIRLNRPPVNALSRAMQEELRAAANEVSADAQIRAVVVAGGPKAFAAGGDIKEMAAMTGDQMAAEAPLIQSAFAAVARIPVPTVAAVTGVAFGGGLELALCCDRRVAGRGVRLGLPEVALGIIPGAGGAQRLTRLVGPARAKEVCFSGAPLDAVTAERWGIVDEVVDDDQVVNSAMAWAAARSEGAPLALRALKSVIDRGLELDLGSALDLETAALVEVFDTADRDTGMASFIESGPGKARFSGA